VSAAVFRVPAKGIALPACWSFLCSPRFHQGYGEFGGLKMFFFKNSREILFFMCVCVCVCMRKGLSEHT